MKKTVLLVVTLLVVVGGVLIAWRLRSSPRFVPEEPKNSSGPDVARSSSPLAAVGAELASSREPASSAAPAGEGELVSAALGRITGIVVDHDDVPLQGAVCEILESTAPAGLTGIVSRDPQLRKSLASVNSSANGGFGIDVPEGFWVLRVTAEGKSPWEEAYLQPGDFRWVRLEPAREMTVVVHDVTDRPVVGAEVRLLRGKSSDRRQAILRVVSDGSGAARLESIPAGTWFVHVSHRDYVSTRERVPDNAGAKGRLDVELQQGIRIEGRVLLAGGATPPPGTQVLFDTTYSANSAHAVRCETDGRYTSHVAFAPGQRLEVAALAPGHGESRRSIYLKDSLSSGVRTEDFTLDSLERIVVGHVVGPRGFPLEGVEVYVRPLLSLPPETVVRIPSGEEIVANGLPDLGAFDPRPSLYARLREGDKTDDSGFYRVTGLHPQKSYNLLLVSLEYSNATLWSEPALPGATTDLGTTELRPAGRVWGYVRRPDGSPIEGVLVRAIDWQTNDVVPDSEFRTRRPAVRAAGLVSITGDSGFFSIQPFPAREFRLGYMGHTSDSYSLAPGEQLGPLEFVTEDLNHRDMENAIPIRLNVVDTLGVPVRRVYASITRVPAGWSESDTLPFDFGSWDWDRGDDSGRVELTASEEGVYRVEVKDMQGLLADLSFRVDLAAEAVEREIVMLADPLSPGLLAGVVLSSTGELLAGVDVTIVPTTGSNSCNCMSFTVKTDVKGEFSFGHFMRGAHRLVVSDPLERFATGHFYPARSGEPIVVRLE